MERLSSSPVDRPPAAGAPRVSVVIVSLRPCAVATPAIAELVRQCDTTGAELVVARRPLDADERWLAALAPAARRITCADDDDVPRMRGAGLAAAGGDWVALTEDCCVAAPDWLVRLGAALSGVGDFAGGVVENAATARALDCAAYYSDWGFYGSVSASRPERPPLATGANAAYRRSVVAEVARWSSAGCWENVVHDRLHAQGARFVAAPAARVFHHLSHRFVDVLRDRFAHGRDYASTRAATLTPARRGLRALLAPALPPLLAWRVWRLAGRRSSAAYARALPLTLLFFAAWSLGEVAGSLRPASPS